MLILLKIGGGSISPKSSYGKFTRENSLRSIARLIRKLLKNGYKFILVHGGGGHAHTPVKCYGILKYLDCDNMIGVSITKLMLYQVKSYIMRILISEAVPVIPVETADIFTGEGLEVSKIVKYVESGFVPLLNGDLVLVDKKLSVVSGDDIMLEIAKHLRPDICLFLIDKPGIVDKDGRTIQVLNLKSIHIYEDSRIVDVTGGILHKIEICKILCRYCRRGVHICSIDNASSIENVIVRGFDSNCTSILCTSELAP